MNSLNRAATPASVRLLPPRGTGVSPAAPGGEEEFGTLADSAFEAARRWNDAVLVARLLAIDPVGLGGVHLKAGAGPVRELWLLLCSQACAPQRAPRRLPPQADESRLIGGLDLSATLQSGRPVLQPGLLSELKGSPLICPMAERLPRRTVAHLTQALDTGRIRMERDGLGAEHECQLAVLALDESRTEDEEAELEPALADRLAFDLDLREVDWRATGVHPLDPSPGSLWEPDELAAMQQARTRLPQIELPQEVLSALVAAAWTLGITSLRMPWWAAQACRALAALRGLDYPGQAELVDAARLVLGPRARQLPAPPPEDPEQQTSPSEPSNELPTQTAPPSSSSEADPHSSAKESPAADLPDELTLAAVQAALPAGLLAQLALQQGLIAPRGRTPSEASSRAGQRLRGGALGRPSGVLPGLPERGRRLALMDTLRQAAPWQSLRRTTLGLQGKGTAPDGEPQRRIIVRREDLRVIRREPRSPTTTVFVVDASGSNALNRLAEAKGAVETLLADCYVRRDRVTVIGFRGQQAELLLPPTRSLVRAKRSLAGLPGGGGTPMARALQESRLLCENLQRRGDTPSLVLLTDGKANVTLEGKAGREQAQADAIAQARAVHHSGIRCLLIDTSPKPQAQARELALAMGARYVPLPQARAGEIGRIVRNIV